MSSKFFEIDFNDIYYDPTPEDFAKVYFNQLYRQLHEKNFSLLITFYGKHRVGKSLAAVDFAYILDHTFEAEMEKRIVYTSKDLIKTFKDIRLRKLKGAGVIIDEAGSGDLSSQRWYEEVAKIISAELQAVGYLNPFIGFVTQSFSFINSTARKLSQGVFEVNRVSNRNSTIKPFWIENNPWFTNSHRHYPIFCEKQEGVLSNVFKLNKINIGLPPVDIKERYDLHSQAFKDKLLTDSEEEIDLLAFEKTKQRIFITGIDAIVEEVSRNANDYMSSSKKGGVKAYLNKDLIRHAHNELSDREARLVKALVEKKISVTVVKDVD